MNEYTRHEALHTVDMICELLNNRVIDHDYMQSAINTEFNLKIAEAMNALWDAYQMCNEDYEDKK